MRKRVEGGGRKQSDIQSGEESGLRKESDASSLVFHLESRFFIIIYRILEISSKLE